MNQKIQLGTRKSAHRNNIRHSTYKHSPTPTKAIGILQYIYLFCLKNYFTIIHKKIRNTRRELYIISLGSSSTMCRYGMANCFYCKHIKLNLLASLFEFHIAFYNFLFANLDMPARNPINVLPTWRAFNIVR